VAFIKIQRCCILYIEQTHIRQILLSISLRFYDYKGHHSSKWERKNEWRKNDDTILLPFLRFFLSSERKINHESEMYCKVVLICIWLCSTSDVTELMIDEHQMFLKCEVKSDQKSS
jgi:hypothetical protein